MNGIHHSRFTYIVRHNSIKNAHLLIKYTYIFIQIATFSRIEVFGVNGKHNPRPRDLNGTVTDALLEEYHRGHTDIVSAVLM